MTAGDTRTALGRAVAWARRHWKPLLVGAGALVIVGVIVRAFWVFDPVNHPATQAAQFRATATALNDPGRAALERELLQYQTDNQIKIWTTIVQASGAVVLAIGGYFAWQNLQVAQRNLRATQDKLDEDRKAAERTETQRTFERQSMEQRLQADREAQITNRFTQAITQLGAELKDGKPNLEVRLGGIYALERIAKDSPRDHWTIMEVLTAYVRENTPWPPRLLAEADPKPKGAPAPPGQDAPAVPDGALRAEQVSREIAKPLLSKPRTDVQAILTVLGRREPPEQFPEPERLDLTRTDLRGASFRFAHLARANFGGAQLEGANFGGAHLARANFALAQLEGADFRGAQLEGANFGSADLRGVRDLTPAQVLSTHDSGRGAVGPPRDWTPEQRAEVQ